MIFSEIYSAYYKAVTKLVEKAILGELTEKNIMEFISDAAFAESFVYISSAIKNEDWAVINKSYQTPIKHIPNLPITELELSFLKAVACDVRFQLFAQIPKQLKDIQPLFEQEDFCVFDKFSDGDDYQNENYRKNFKTILQALKEKRRLNIEFYAGKGGVYKGIYTPRKLEFSAKDDKFRLICSDRNFISNINLNRITICNLGEIFDEKFLNPLNRVKSSIEIEINDERNALERMMMTFANYQKETKKIGDNKYILKLSYYKEDETELLIRVLSFGPMAKVLSPKEFIVKIKERIAKQIKLRN